MARDELFSAPADLTLLSVADLTELQDKGRAEIDRLNSADTEEVSGESVSQRIAYASRVADDLDRISAELEGKQATAARLAEQARIKAADQMSAIAARVNGPVESATETAPVAAAVDTEAIAKATAQGVTAALATMMSDRRGGLDADTISRRATASLSETARVAPAAQVSTPRLAVTASIDIPGVSHGSELTSMDSLGEAFAKKSRAIPVSRSGSTDQGHIVATVKNRFDHTVDDRTSFAQVGELINHLTRQEVKESLVAGGGWCAPSETRYDFFNIACSDGLIDLPTVGITRGGIKFPISPSLASAVGSTAFGGFAVSFSNTSNPWLWTEADDILTVTGSTNKPCIRVPCPSFDEERLECYGICLTAGNLTNDAYPEATQNTIQLLMQAHERAMNARLIALMVANSSAVISTNEFANGGTAATAKPVFQQVLGGIDLGATDYRARYGMCTDDILEVVAPYWLRNVIRADLAWRTGVDMLSVSDLAITSFFTDRNLRVQWVNDWQVRGSGQFGNATPMTAWPTTADVMIFAAGTFIHGQGMTLDLGVIRDSVLNAENDYTAAWSEECHLIAAVGHESRQYRITFSVMGATTVAQVVPGTSLEAFPNL
jgi:hypothetical protein